MHIWTIGGKLFCKYINVLKLLLYIVFFLLFFSVNFSVYIYANSVSIHPFLCMLTCSKTDLERIGIDVAWRCQKQDLIMLNIFTFFQIIWRTSLMKNKQTNPGLLSKQIVEASDTIPHLLNQSEYHFFLSLLLNVILITEEQNIRLDQADILRITSYRKTLALQFQLKILL